MRIKMVFLVAAALLLSCWQKNKNVNFGNTKKTVNADSALIETIMNQQKFILANAKIDSILPLKAPKERGYFYFQKGFSCMMLERHEEAISNFEKALLLNYQVKATKMMIQTTKEMKQTYD